MRVYCRSGGIKQVARLVVCDCVALEGREAVEDVWMVGGGNVGTCLVLAPSGTG